MSIFVLVLFFFSGFVGLLYEVVWTRIFGLIFGNTTLAISTVLSAFFLGLAMGGWFLGRAADRHKNPLRLFAWLELGVGLSALLFLLLHRPLELFFALVHPGLVGHTFAYYIVKFAAAFIVMLPATFFMGGTLPVISRAVLRNSERYGRAIGILYAVNTLGAVAGCLLTAFLLIRSLGITTTLTGAIALDGAIALAAWLGAKRFRDGIAVQRPKAAAPGDTAPGADAAIILLAMALSGFIALSYEVLWSRVLVFVLTASTYSFAIILAAFLSGLAGGGFAGGKWADHSRSPRRLLGRVEAAVGLSALLAMLVMIKLPALHDQLFVPGPATTWWQWNAIRFLEAFLVMFAGTFFLGATFPIAVKAMGFDEKSAGRSIGRLYFANTLGGVLGSFMTGFILISWLGSAAAMMVMITMNLALGWFLISGSRRARRLLIIPAAVMLALAAAIWTPKDLFVGSYAISETNYPLVAFREGLEGTVTVHASRAPMPVEKRIDVDGLNVAGTSFMLQTLQTLQGHLPYFVNPDATSAVQIGFGTGQTSRNALTHPIVHFDLVEISPDVMRLAAEQFSGLNGSVTADPRFHKHILDGKNYLKYTRDRYDVIMNDANYAVASSSASLFTMDHFQNGRRKLNPDGIFSTWMTTDLHPEDFKIVLRTFQSVFPHALLWMAPNCVNKQVVLMGSTEPLHLDLAGMSSLLENEEIRKSLAAVNIGSVFELMTCLLLDEKGMAAISGDAEVATDNLPILEYSTRDIRARDWCAYQNLAMMMTQPPVWKDYLVNLPAAAAERAVCEGELARHYRASRQLFSGILSFYQGQTQKAMEIVLDGSRLIPESRLAAQFYQEMDQLTAELGIAMQKDPGNTGNRMRFARHMISLRKYPEAARQLRGLLAKQPGNALVNYEYARCLYSEGKMDSALVFINRALEVDAKSPGAWFLSAAIARQRGEMDAALAGYKRALQFDPRMHEAWAQIGAIHLQREELANAQSALHKSLDLSAFQPGPAADLGDCYLRAGEAAKAITWYKKAMIMGEQSARLYHNLGNAQALLGQYVPAVASYRRALELQDRNGEIYYNLGNALAMQGEHAGAVQAFQKAIDLDSGQPDYFNNLALVNRRLGRHQEALRIFAEGLRLHPNSELLKKNYQETISYNNGRAEK
jgi:spermidine synthase